LAIAFEALGPHHDRSRFASGAAELDEWFRQRAGQDERRDVARVFVAVDDAVGIVGFYSLSTFTISIPDLPDDIARKLPRYETIPAALIGRLARDLRVRGKGIGDLLLADAVRRILGASRSLAVFAIIVDAKDEGAKRFYGEFGFRPFPQRPQRMFLSIANALAAFGASQ
jgi:GNAT superfamily N-acetyltransferase